MAEQILPILSLKSMTEWVAEEYDEQATKGTLEAGKLTDLVILDRDPLKVDPMAIKFLETTKQGNTIYPAGRRRCAIKIDKNLPMACRSL